MTEREINSKETMAGVIAQRTATEEGLNRERLLLLFAACSAAISFPDEKHRRIKLNSNSEPQLKTILEQYNISLHELSGHIDLTTEELIATYCTLWSALKFLLYITTEKVQRPATV